MVEPEARDPAQQRAGRDPALGEPVEQLVDGPPGAVAVALAEVAGESQAVVDDPLAGAHQRPPIARPASTASSPSARLPATFAASTPNRPSSAARWLSSIQVEKVV